eukprot:7947000-Alexandrium_andersonii.AAC.1
MSEERRRRGQRMPHLVQRSRRHVPVWVGRDRAARRSPLLQAGRGPNEARGPDDAAAWGRATGPGRSEAAGGHEMRSGARGAALHVDPARRAPPDERRRQQP